MTATEVQASRREFEQALIGGLIRASHAFEPNNVDRWRFPARGLRELGQRLREATLAAAYRRGFVRARPAGPASAAKLAYVLDHLDELAWLYQRLADATSRELLVDLLKYRILGRDHVRLPTNGPSYWDARASIDRLYLRRPSAARSSDGEDLGLYALPGTGGPIQLVASPLDVLNMFLLQQYAYRAGSREVAVKPGAIVLDGGGCWGDSALYFADRAGAAGQVHSFEFVPANLELLRRNLAANPALAERVTVVPAALWDAIGERLQYTAAGPETRVTTVPGSGGAPTQTIDQYVAQADLPRVDFIKLDIEGSELRALRGAERTLHRWRPTLAVALYHRLQDFVEIPRYIADLGLGYRLYLGHYTIHAEETILFAAADGPA